MKQRYYLNDVGEANKIIDQLMQNCQHRVFFPCPLECLAWQFCPFKEEYDLGKSNFESGTVSHRATQSN